MIRAGDIFCANHGSELAADFIRMAEELWSADGKAKYSHAGIITSADGETFEALSDGVKRCSLDKYQGVHIKIMRPVRTLIGNPLDDYMKADAIQQIIKKYDGRSYPWWRIPLFLIPPLARAIRWGRHDAVCGEIVGLYLDDMGCIIGQPFGLTPDDISDIGSTHRSLSVVFEGVYYEY